MEVSEYFDHEVEPQIPFILNKLLVDTMKRVKLYDDFFEIA